MKNKDDFLAYVLDQLRLMRIVEARAMFGGHGLYFEGAFFGIVAQGRVYLKTSPLTRRRFIEARMKPFRPNARQTLKTYYEVPAEVLDDASSVAQWAREAASIA